MVIHISFSNQISIWRISIRNFLFAMRFARSFSAQHFLCLTEREKSRKQAYQEYREASTDLYFNPKYAQMATTILRTYYNFCLPYKSYDKKKLTPAQRLGITEKQFKIEDILYIR